MIRFRSIAAGLALWLSLSGIAVAGELFDFQPLADGVYGALAKPTFRPNCNAGIVLLDDGVLVVDSEAKPSAAQEVIAYIQHLTDKPVKYLVITHFHGDHTQGAETYLRTWPGAQIIATEATRVAIEQRARARLRHESLNIPAQMEKLRSQLQQTANDAEKQRIEKTLREAQTYLAETKTMQIAMPTITVTDQLILKQKSRSVEILYLGRAHTNGDLFVFLPQEKVLFTGDSLQSLTPTMRDSYPSDWIRTLDAAEKLDFDTVLGGHGDVFRGKATFDLWKQYFADLMQGASEAYARGESLDETRRSLIPELLSKYQEKFPPRLKETIVSNVEKAYRVASGETD